MSPDYLLLIPLVYTLYAFIRLVIDQQIIWREYEKIKATDSKLANEMGQPVSMFNAWRWMREIPLGLEKSDLQDLGVKSYQEIQLRLRTWNRRRFPILVLLWIALGTLRAFLEQR